MLADLPEEISCEQENVREIILMCGSFLTIREDSVYFIHQSAKDYFSIGKGSKVFLEGQAEEHGKIAY